MLRLLFSLAILISMPSFSQDNTWINPGVKFVLPSGIQGAQWSTSDGFCTAVARQGNGSILWRSGVGQNSSVTHPKLDPGFYSNATLEWTPSTDSVRVVDVFNWDGGSYSDFSPLPAFSVDTTPVPRHTYDGLAYVPGQDALYLMLGAYGRGAPDSGLARELYLLDDTASTWKFTFSDRKWRRIRGNIRRFWPSVYTVSSYESHLRYWPAGNKLLFANDGGSYHAEFDIQTETWTNVSSNQLKAPFSLYNARSTWDSKRGLWVFRNGKNVCTYNPVNRSYDRLPDIRVDTAHGRGITYDSRHDVYIAPINTTKATAVFSFSDSAWTEISGSVTLPDAWCVYDSLSDWVCYVNQHTVLKFRYNPATAGISVGTANPRMLPSLDISPNPFSGSARIYLAGVNTGEMTRIGVYTLAGREVFSGKVTGPEMVWKSGLAPAGIYCVRVTTARGAFMKRVTCLR